MKPVLIVAALAARRLRRATRPLSTAAEKDESRSCLPCHSLRLIHSQRLSRAAWNKELDKMAGWGARFQDREAILEYLVATYGDDKPPASPVCPEMALRRSSSAIVSATRAAFSRSARRTLLSPPPSSIPCFRYFLPHPRNYFSRQALFQCAWVERWIIINRRDSALGGNHGRRTEA